MAYFDSSSPLQLMLENVEKLYNSHGWDTLLKYRVIAPASGGRTRKFARVFLFQSKGTDGQVRNLGVIHSHGGKTPTPFGEEEVITHSSSLGKLVQDATDPKKFYFQIKPILTSYIRLFVNNLEVDVFDTSIVSSIDSEKGILIFAAGYDLGTNPVVTANYGVSDDAPDMPSKLWWFTFEDVITERFMNGVPLTLSGGSYKPSVSTKCKPGALAVYDGGVRIDQSNYTVSDWDDLSVTFAPGYTVSGAVTADYIVPLSKNGVEMEDVIVPDFDVKNGEKTYEAVLSTLHFIYPSIPTTTTFVDAYTAAWTRESEMFYWGNITKNRIVMFFRVDPSPDPVKSYYTPLYVGKLITFGKQPKLNNVLIGGSNTADIVSSTAIIDVGSKHLDYGPFATNGNDAVLLQQTVGGAFYQKHYLSFITHDNKADVSPESRYNPSVYSGKYHISPIYVVHPNDGYVGILDEVYAIHPKNIAQLDELEVIEEVNFEAIGIGDGVNKVFHLTHTPKEGVEVKISVDCQEVPFTRVTGEGINATDEQLKAVTLNTAPADGKTVYASYRYEQTYIYSMPTTPECPFFKESVSPYTPIGLGILKKNEPFES